LEGLEGDTGLGFDTGGLGGTYPASFLPDPAGFEVGFCDMLISYF
jgi:hypothetical protein